MSPAVVPAPMWTATVSPVGFGGSLVLVQQALSFSFGVNSLVGRNGAGKTTLYKCLLGLLPNCDSSIVTPEGRRISSSDRHEFMASVGYLPQDVPHPRSMKAIEFVEHAAWLKGLDRGDARSMAREALARVNLTDHRSTGMANLSGGMRRRAGLAAAIVHRPTILVLDEPTSGLDPLERSRFHALVTTLARDHVVLVSTHLLEDVEGLGGRVSVLSRGMVRDVGPVRELVERGSLADTILPLLDHEVQP